MSCKTIFQHSLAIALLAAVASSHAQWGGYRGSAPQWRPPVTAGSTMPYPGAWPTQPPTVITPPSAYYPQRGTIYLPQTAPIAPFAGATQMYPWGMTPQPIYYR